MMITSNSGNAETLISQVSSSLKALFEQAGLDQEFLGQWPVESPSRPTVDPDLNVARQIPTMLELAPTHMKAVVDGIIIAKSQLYWGQTYRDGVEEGFLDRYGWAEVFGLKGPIECETCAGGILLLAPNTLYPPHSHPAIEYYVPISGTAEWYDVERGWRREKPGSLIHHKSGVIHAMRTTEQPLLAAYLWVGKDLNVAAQLESDRLNSIDL